MIVATKKMTVSEFRQLEFDDDDPYFYELINGEIVRKSAPSPLHQRVSLKLERKLDNFIQEHQLGELFHSPIDVFYDDFNQNQPDIIFISNENAHIVDDFDGILGAPNLVVEIVSPGSVIIDRVDKKGVFQKTGVREYWIVDPNNRTIEVYGLRDGGYQLTSSAEITGKISSQVLQGFEVEIVEIFDPPPARKK
ncbi:MAG: Uma2 family endonuclease [Bacteroidota bacterium]